MDTHWTHELRRDLDKQKPITLGNRVRLYLAKVEHLISENITRNEETSSWSRSCAAAWDVQDILQRTPNARRRRIKIDSQHGYWPAIVALNTDHLVVCGRSLGSPIRPVLSTCNGMCDRCLAPSSFRYCLIGLLHDLRGGALLSKKYAWIRARAAFASCSDTSHGHAFRVQKLQKVSFFHHIDCTPKYKRNIRAFHRTPNCALLFTDDFNDHIAKCACRNAR